MRTLSSTLSAEQKKLKYIPLHKIVLTKSGQTTQTYATSRILESKYIEQPGSQTAQVILNNSDGALTSLNLRGYQGVISNGATTSSGDEYSAKPPLTVIEQQLYSSRGLLICALTLVGLPDLLKQDKANVEYTPDSTNTDTVKTILSAIAGATLACFNHCTAFTITYDSEDSLIDSFQPKDSFSIQFQETRWSVIQRLLSWTKCVPRAEDDGELHILVPKKETSTAWVKETAYALRDQVIPTTANGYQYICTTAGTSGATEPTWPTTIGGTVTDGGTLVWTVSYDYEYSLASSNHTFFNKTVSERIVIPSYVTVSSNPVHDESYTGYAEDTDSSDLLEKRVHYYLRVSSNAQCTAIATAILAHAQWDAEEGRGFVPMNVGAEVHDLNKITDSRQSDSKVGNIGYIVTHYKANTWTMDFGFGKASIGDLSKLAFMGGEAAGTTVTELLGDIINEVDQIYELINNIHNIIRQLKKRIIYLKAIAAGTALTTGDGKIYVTLPSNLNGMNLIDVDAGVYTASTSGTPTIAVYNVTDSQDMLSTDITIDENETNSFTATTPPVINTDYDDVATGDILRVDVDVAGTGTKGLDVILVFE